MLNKSTTNYAPEQIHRIPAGIMVGDTATELFGDRATKKVYGISNGQTIPFENLSKQKLESIYEQMILDNVAMNDLKHLPAEKAIEEYAFCIFGAADSDPDFDANGKLGKADNFICSSNCRCLRWNSKSITINGIALTSRQVTITNLLASDKPDKQIASELKISESTLDSHKRKLYEKVGVNSKAGLIMEAVKSKVIQ